MNINPIDILHVASKEPKRENKAHVFYVGRVFVIAFYCLTTAENYEKLLNVTGMDIVHFLCAQANPVYFDYF